MPINLQQIKTFLWVAKLGGFRRAAEKLYASQPAVSARIASLEEALGVPLLERTTGGVRLTSKGQDLLGYAEQLTLLVETIEERIGDPAEFEGVLRLGVSETIVQSWLPVFLARLRELYPKVNLELSVDVSVNLRDDLLSRALDLALLMGPVSEYSVTNLELPDFPIAWYVGGRIAEEAVPGDPEELLLQHPVITYARNTRPFSEIKAELLRRYGPSTRLFPSSSLSACFQMVRDGVGIGTLPVALASGAVQRGELFELPLPWRPKALQFTASFVSEPSSLMARRTAELAQETARSWAN